jgi:hypothetical protein
MVAARPSNGLPGVALHRPVANKIRQTQQILVKTSENRCLTDNLSYGIILHRIKL